MAGKRSAKGDAAPVGTAVAEDKKGADDQPIFPDSAVRVEEPGEVVYEFEPDKPDTDSQEPADPAKPAAGGDGTPAKVAVVATDAEKLSNLQKALRQERGKRRSVLAELEATKERLRLVDGGRRVRDLEAERAARDAKLDEANDIKDALPVITEAVRADLDPHIAAARRAGVTASERVSRLVHPDYDEVLQKSGVQAAITIDPATGRSPDPVMWRMLLIDSDDPAEDAYNLALDILEKKGPAPAAVETKPGEPVVLDRTGGDRSEGRREVLTTIEENADRPQGVRRLPAAEGRVIRRLTSDDISAMSEEEYARLPAHVRQAYLAGGQI